MLWTTVLLALSAPPDDAKLDAHLAGWEKVAAGLTSLRTQFELTRTEAVFRKQRQYAGTLACLKPNLVSLRLQSKTDKAEAEEYLFDGAAVYEFDGRLKTVTEFRVDPAGAADNALFALVGGMRSADLKKRFAVALQKEDQHYVYLDIKPRAGKDQQEFEVVNIVLFGPGTKFPYLPALVKVTKPNGDTEVWTFSQPETNVPGLDKKAFELKVPAGFTLKKSPPVPGRP